MRVTATISATKRWLQRVDEQAQKMDMTRSAFIVWAMNFMLENILRDDLTEMRVFPREHFYGKGE